MASDVLLFTSRLLHRSILAATFSQAATVLASDASDPSFGFRGLLAVWSAVATVSADNRFCAFYLRQPPNYFLFSLRIPKPSAASLTPINNLLLLSSV